MNPNPAQEQVKFWHAHELDNLELLRAKYITHAFTRHIHEGFAIGVIEQGAEAFYYRGDTHVAPAGSLVAINPGEIHTGQAVDETGWAYRMLYPEVALVQRAMVEITGNPQDIPYFPNPVIQDEYSTRLMRQLHLTLEDPTTTALEQESRFISTLVQLITRHADTYPRLPKLPPEHQAIKQARDYLDAHYMENVSLEQLANVAHLSPFHLLRAFRTETGLPPHAYLTQIRIARAKELLSRGWPPARVAAETGFVDQSHLTKRFKAVVGVAPGQYISKNIQDKSA